MNTSEAIKRAEAAADAAETAATRLQIKTEDATLDRTASAAKGLIHNAREALDEIQGESEAGTVTDEAAAKVTAAAKAVEEELKEVAHELGGLTSSPSAVPKIAGESVVTERAAFKTTEQAVKELELLAKVNKQNKFAANVSRLLEIYFLIKILLISPLFLTTFSILFHFLYRKNPRRTFKARPSSTYSGRSGPVFSFILFAYSTSTTLSSTGLVELVCFLDLLVLLCTVSTVAGRMKGPSVLQ
jgi:hypothetical protein